jgi:hypothetical protein
VPLLDYQALDWGALNNDLDLSTFLAPIGTDMQLNVTESAVGERSRAWFLSPESWVVDHTPFPVPPNFEMSDLKVFLRLIQDWFETWITTGSNIFIHAKLYHDKLPACVQAAYTTLSAYTNKTPDNTDMILRIANEQAKELVTTIKSTPAHSWDLFEHLAHVQALFAYQIIGLLDGDIRTRHLAEQRSPTFVRLLNQLLEYASTSVTQTPMGWELDEVMTPSLDHTDARKALWQTWIVSESTRRTWLVGMGFNAGYDGLKQGWTPCAGDIPFTCRNGLWAAPSADVWGQLYAPSKVQFIQRFNAAWVFQDISPNDMDEFGKKMLEITYGKEKMKEWVNRWQC